VGCCRSRAGYAELLEQLKARVRSSQVRAARAAANSELLQLYWSVGRDILDRQEQAGSGSRVIDRLPQDLQAEFPDQRGCGGRRSGIVLRGGTQASRRASGLRRPVLRPRRSWRPARPLTKAELQVAAFTIKPELHRRTATTGPGRSTPVRPAAMSCGASPGPVFSWSKVSGAGWRSDSSPAAPPAVGGAPALSAAVVVGERLPSVAWALSAAATVVPSCSLEGTASWTAGGGCRRCSYALASGAVALARA